MPEHDTVERAVEDLRENEVAELIMQSTGQLSDEPRTVRGTFPGSKTRAMGHALEVVEIVEDHDLEAEREYIGPVEGRDSHEIHVHIEGGEKA